MIQSKKGVELLLTKVINLVIAVIVFLILAYFVFKVFSLFDKNNKLEKINDRLEELSKTVREVFAMKSCNGNCERNVLFFPEPSWFLKTFINYKFPDGQCRGSISCLCVCDTENCDTRYISCQGFDFDVKVTGKYTESLVLIEPGGTASQGDLTISEVIEFKEEAIELQIIKEGNLIRIGEVK